MPATPLGQVQANGRVTQIQLQEAVNALTDAITNGVNGLEEKTKNEIDKTNLQIQAITQQNLDIAGNFTRESESSPGRWKTLGSMCASA